MSKCDKQSSASGSDQVLSRQLWSLQRVGVEVWSIRAGHRQASVQEMAQGPMLGIEWHPDAAVRYESVHHKPIRVKAGVPVLYHSDYGGARHLSAASAYTCIQFRVNNWSRRQLRLALPFVVTLGKLPPATELARHIGDFYAKGSVGVINPFNSFNVEALCQLGMRVAITCMDRWQRSMVYQSAELGKDLHRVVSHILEHLTADLSNEALARQARCSTSHLHRLFREAVGMTPQAFVLRSRLQYAADRLLLRNDESIDAIAMASGFANRYIFTRHFSKQFGCGPAEYARRFQRHQAKRQALRAKSRQKK